MESVSAIGLFSGKMSAGFKRPCPGNNSDNTSDSDSECTLTRQDLLHGVSSSNGSIFGEGPKPGKKTKGRVKIKMEFIENKLRRYTTFSKRKTGIMKKAYELSTLTGTQVMLLVASETGHVYTFATRKLQPMITSESGKALIQTCLNSPDSPLDHLSADQRMNPTGYEETDLSYAVSDDESSCHPVSNSSSSKIVPDKQVAPSSSNISSSSSSSRGHQTTNAASSIASSSSVQHRLLYQLGQDLPPSARLPDSVPSMELRLKQEPLSSCNVSVSKSEGHNQQKTKECPVREATSPVTSIPVSTAAAVSSSSPVQPSSAMVHRGLSAAGGGGQSSTNQQHQQTFYKIPGTNQIISVSFTGTNGPSGVLCQTYTTSSSSSNAGSSTKTSYSYLPQTATLGAAIDPQSGNSQQFITIPIPINVPNAASQMSAHQLLTPIKSELLPTDLRYNSLEKNNRV